MRRTFCLLSASFILLLWASTASTQTADPLSSTPEISPSLAIGEAVIATSMDNLAPLGVADSFNSDVEKLYAFTRIQGAEGEALVKHLWFHHDDLVAEVELSVRSANWRTYSSKKILPSMTGQWKVDVTDESGTLLTSIPFTVE